MRTLIVDDSHFIREYLRQQMEALGASCEEACDGNHALEVLGKSDAFELMLIDVNMPGMGGLECVRELRQRGLSAGVRIMMVTTEADNSFIRQALEYGADEFLMKPFTPQSLREKLLMLGLC